MNYPSIKTLCQITDRETAIKIRAILRREVPIPCGGCHKTDEPHYCRTYHDGRCRPNRLVAIDRLLGTHGVEHQPAGRTATSPAFHYCNAGDPYDGTIIKIGDRFRVGCWGDIVERGSYA